MTNSSENCNFTAIDNLAWSVQLGLSIPTSILGLVLNIPALCVFCSFWRNQSKTSVYMISLVLADILLLLSLPLKLYFSAAEAPGLLCSFIQAPYFVNTYISIFIIVCITVDRYTCIKHPFEGRANQSPRWAVVICCFIWAVAWICSIPIFVFQKKEPRRCFHNMSSQTWSVPYIVSVEIFGFLIPLAVMVFCSAQTIWILLNRNTHDKKKEEEESGSLRVIVINLVVFLVCFTPVHLGILLQCLVRQHVIVGCRVRQTISLFLQVSMTFANLNCCLDAIFYYFAAKEFYRRAQLGRVIELCPAFNRCAMRRHRQQWDSAPSQDTDSAVPDLAGTVPQGQGQ
ncbi:G-protein coupled receptor 55 [Melozone crissalis]|uniref:G-protein coupled receptor 55 n=1 Tax=Melozone crissalis TaxID=40204 RepID=UPI0023DA1264|nr:G-protein coupled receptor 55 [Melozone crissalis]